MRPLEPRIVRAMEDVDARLDEIGGQIAAIARRGTEPDRRLAETINSSHDLGEVMQRTLAAAEAVRNAHGSSMSLRRSDGTFATAVRGFAQASFVSAGALEDRDGAPLVAQLASSSSAAPESVRARLTVPLGEDRCGSLSVYSREPGAFDREASTLLAAISDQAAPAVLTALRSFDAERPAAQIFQSGRPLVAPGRPRPIRGLGERAVRGEVPNRDV
jgi:hypothetical protein